MTLMKHSPITFTASALRTEERDGWVVCLEFADQGEGPWLVDLSHKRKWDVQSSDLSAYRPGGVAIPTQPGQSILQDGWLINRMNRTQAAAWRLDSGEGTAAPDPDAQPAYTETTDAQALLALVGEDVVPLTELITAMDLFGFQVNPPALFQGPVLHVPCQVVRLGTQGDQETVLIACSRGYGQTMAAALLSAGDPYGLTAGGEKVFAGAEILDADRFQGSCDPSIHRTPHVGGNNE